MSSSKHRPTLLAPRWLGLALGLFAATVDTWGAAALGIRFQLEGTGDATWMVFAYLALSLGGLGFAVGYLIELRRKERATAAALTEAQARVGRKETLVLLGQLASTIAHEVRNPLAVIRSTVQSLQEDIPDSDEEGRESCHFALDEIDRLNHVIGAILGFAKPIRVDAKPVRVSELLNRVGQLSARFLTKRRLELELPKSDESTMLEADADLLCQALLGLLANAAEVSPRGSVIELSLRRDAESIVLTVTDSGPGVPEDLREKVFEPFFTTRDEGHGLGLAVVRQIAKAHGGQIEVDTGTTGGARFTLTLPQNESARKKAA